MRRFLLGGGLCFIYLLTKGQSVTINMGTTPAHPSAILEVFSQDKGVLLPRMTAVRREAIQNPASGLLVYQTDGLKGIWFFDGIRWRNESLGTQPGEMKYWNGVDWVIIAPGQNGEILTLCDGVPRWGPCPAADPDVKTDSISRPADSLFRVHFTVKGSSNQLLESGVAFGTLPNPVVSGTYRSSLSGLVGNLSVALSGWLPATLYYVRAYTRTTDGRVFYGNQLSLSTPSAVSALVRTLPATAISKNGFILNGEVVQEGQSPVTARGFVWSRTPLPMLANALSTNGTGPGKFEASITGLLSNTRYFIRAYAVNAQGVAYGEELDILTLTDSARLLGNFVTLTGGSFSMGSNLGNNIEKPIHPVTLKAFSMGTTEVTQDQWFFFMGENPAFQKGCGSCPVENVSWLDIQEFLRRINAAQSLVVYRLPTEAEWEFAAKGGKDDPVFRYAGSDNIGDVAWYKDNSGLRTRPVGSQKPNALGLFDMSGNVWEWVQDWYNFYKADALTNPTGPITGSSRLYRGGSFEDIADDCRVSYRYGNPPASRFRNLGFRLAHD